MSIAIKKINKFCGDYLEAAKWPDYCVNGLQVAGTETVSKAVCGVSLSVELIKEAIRRQAQLIMVHHGIFKSDISSPPVIQGYMRQRLKLLLAHDINLIGFHLPLDAHPLIGNNISILKKLGLTKVAPLNSSDHEPIGFLGRTKVACDFLDFVNQVEDKLDTSTYSIAGTNSKVRLVGIVSGGASPDFAAAAEQGADTYLCGDIRESTVRAVEETGINFINAGHYNTEKLGIQNLGKLVAKKFGIEVEFVDIPNEI